MNCRKALSVVLLLLVTFEILPCSFHDDSPLATGGTSGVACSIEPLQVCDQGDSPLGSLANALVLVPGDPPLILAPELLGLVVEHASFAPDGFRPSIDHPPQLLL
jgi:hypothetical protein